MMGEDLASLVALRKAYQAAFIGVGVLVVGALAVQWWFVASVLGVSWMLARVMFVSYRRRERALFDLAAYHDWLRWKAHQG